MESVPDKALQSKPSVEVRMRSSKTKSAGPAVCEGQPGIGHTQWAEVGGHTTASAGQGALLPLFNETFQKKIAELNMSQGHATIQNCTPK